LEKNPNLSLTLAVTSMVSLVNLFGFGKYRDKKKVIFPFMYKAKKNNHIKIEGEMTYWHYWSDNLQVPIHVLSSLVSNRF
jgi:hypothetical protein